VRKKDRELANRREPNAQDAATAVGNEAQVLLGNETSRLFECLRHRLAELRAASADPSATRLASECQSILAEISNELDAIAADSNAKREYRP